MKKKRILIVDDEESILTVLKGALKKMDPNYEIVTATDGFVALDEIKKEPFDLVISDFNMTQMDGLELIEAIQYIDPTTKIIMITAYGSDAVELETGRLQTYRYLTKPLEIKTFRQIVQGALKDKAATSRPSVLALSGGQYQQVSRMIEQLRSDVGARCVFLADTQGQTIARRGHTDKLPAGEMASLLGAGIATLGEAGRALDDDDDAINLAYRESKNSYLYALNIGRRLLLILVIDRGSYSSRLGTVWYHARQTALALRQVVSEAEPVTSQQVFNSSTAPAFEAELDKLFGAS